MQLLLDAATLTGEIYSKLDSPSTVRAVTNKTIRTAELNNATAEIENPD